MAEGELLPTLAGTALPFPSGDESLDGFEAGAGVHGASIHEIPLVAKRNPPPQAGRFLAASHGPVGGSYCAHRFLRIRLPNVVIEQMSPATVVIEQTTAQAPRMRRLPATYWMVVSGFSSLVCMVVLSGFIVAPNRFLSLILDSGGMSPLMNGRIVPPF